MRISRLCSTAVASAALVCALSPAAPALARGGAREHAGVPNHKVAHGTSTNWSGFAVQGAGPYTSVSASWTQPAVECTTTPKGWSAFWVGLDGDTTNTVEQTGTEADCSGGKPLYYAWYEMYPKFSVNYANKVSPNDHFAATVTYLGGGSFGLTLTDSTQHWTRTTTQRLTHARLGSAEAIAEAPSSGGVLPLADFGTVDFAETKVDNSLLTSSTPGIERITMVTSGGTVKAAPSGIKAGEFEDTWHSQ